jgi:TPR repeat protein
MFRILMAFAALILMTSPVAAEYSAGATAYSEGDFKAAYREFVQSAKDGDARAQFAIGVMYHKGKGIAKDYAKALEWYAKAAEQGHATAQNNLGIMYRRGEGVSKSPREAFTWIWMAAMQDNARAEMNLADMFRRGEGVGQDLLQAYAWLDFAMNDLPKGARKLAQSRRNQIVAQLNDHEVARAQRMAQALKARRE